MMLFIFSCTRATAIRKCLVIPSVKYSLKSGSIKHVLRLTNVCQPFNQQRHKSLSSLIVGHSGSPMVTATDVEVARIALRELVGTPKTWSEEREEAAMTAHVPTSQAELPARKMKDSYREAVIPLAGSVELQQKYVNFWNAVRFGRIMEDLDSMAVWISYTHNQKANQKKSALSIVTAAVDRIDIGESATLLPDKDIYLRGHVTWAGSTSMEVTMEVEQEQNGVLGKILEARFLMVARDPHNKVKAYINPLSVEGPEEQAIFDSGLAHKAQHILEAKRSLLKTLPTEEERQTIHDIFLSTLDTKWEGWWSGSFKNIKKLETSVWMEDTKLKNMIICFPEERNLYNKIFGGFLMRSAFELGWTNACLYSKSRPYLLAVDDILFTRPVEIGSLLYLSSQVCYTSGPHIQVKVHAAIVDPKTGDQLPSNVFHYTFKLHHDLQAPPVIPKAYAEYMMYLDGKRHFEGGFLRGDK